MAAGYRAYSFDWARFRDLTSDAGSEIPEALGRAILDAKTRQRLKLPAKLPKKIETLSALIRDLFLEPEWYVEQPLGGVTLRHRLLFAMFFDGALKSIGLGATPAWREFHEDCSFDAGAVLAGRSTLDLDRMKRGGGLFFRIVADATPGDNPFWWFGQRPYRHGAWGASNEEVRDFEEEFEREVFSIQSPEEVDALGCRLAEESSRLARVESEELRDLLADYRHCIEVVKARGAGMLVENDY